MATVGVSARNIFTAIIDKLKADNCLPDGDVYLSFRQNPPALENKKILVVVPLYSTFLQETTEGHGRKFIYKKGRVQIYYRHNAAVDENYQDDHWALDDDGLIAVLDKVEDSLDLYHPQDFTGNFLLRHPMRAFMTNEPRKDYKDQTQGDAMVELEIEWQALRTTP